MKVTENGIRVFSLGEQDPTLTDSDRDMDSRVKEAVRVAIEKAKFLKQPIARYDSERKQAYMEYPNGDRIYAE